MRQSDLPPSMRYNPPRHPLPPLPPFPFLLSEEQMLTAVELGHAAVKGMCVQMEAWAAQVRGSVHDV